MSWLERLRLGLEGRPARELEPASGERRAAVLVALLDLPSGPEVLLHRRAAELSRHPRQVAFPGGVVDPGDASPAAAALRETHEELGIVPGRVALVGRLSDQRTTTGFVVTPVVGVVRGAVELTPRTAEVEAVLRLPVERLLAPGAFSSATRTVRGLRVTGEVARWQGDEIWGATARILLALRRVLVGPRRSRPCAATGSGPDAAPRPGSSGGSQPRPPGRARGSRRGSPR